MRKKHVKGRKAYNGGQEAIREHNSQRFSSPAYLQPSFWDHVTNHSSFRWLAEHMLLTVVRLVENYALNKKYVLNSEQCLATNFYGN